MEFQRNQKDNFKYSDGVSTIGTNLSFSDLNTRMVKMIEYDQEMLRLQITNQHMRKEMTHQGHH